MEGGEDKMKILLPLSIIIFAVILRLLPHPPNFAPIAAMAIFGGAYLNKKYALAIPLLAMFFSDFILGFHSTIPFVYGSFLISGLMGMWIGKKRSLSRFFFGTFLSSVLFFIVTNFGVFLTTSLYPKTLDGLILCFTMAIPFFRNTILSDLFYVSLFVASYEFILTKLASKLALLGHENLHQKRR
jgi:hypothetical protein